ncbi:Ist1p KNAG_0F00500 [Huiozyma naganishii CBS 8797]|uniref:Uncharacterized protein n=1 Tax=Huiozyma naganishii (strain ATCC MYA-139 / BCRC 22969 / CBS 8797 / KCTC 17520 / NBRC 10181 / NCYC 3082 / Yp74L-3) TaxID=1071383 RepID=J7S718_HUIN7|nr:hypothetical protein KNAG_0F00500 [Kazachstania naganishii CBS 8797]CCK70719.1 hypothetical protein KNAG_0F00500 [Kazachstania naganishii CBS 8797]
MPPAQVPFALKVKTLLKMCIQRLRYAQEKQQALAKQDRREVAQLLTDGREQKAHYRVESLVNNDVHVELLEVLELYCELLLARVGILTDVKDEADLVANHMQDGINEAVRSLCYTVPHVLEVKEIAQLRDQIALKFGKDYLRAVTEDALGVPQKVVSKCSPNLPGNDLVVMYLKEIARTYDVPYSQLSDSEPESTESLEEKSVDAEDKPFVAVDNDVQVDSDDKHPITVRKPRQNSETMKQDLKIPKNIKHEVKVVHSKASSKSSEDDEFAELKKRFENLRR